MANAKKPYRRLPGTGYNRLAFVVRGLRFQLWQGEEHLLYVESNGYRERYKRFAYRDIQAVTMRKTVEGQVVNIIFGCIAAFFAAIGMLTSEPGARIFLFITAGTFLSLLFINIFRGPTCVCEIRTAVQTVELPSLNRLKRARKALNRIRPMIAAAQGSLTAEEIPARMKEWVAPGAEPQPSPAGPAQAAIDDLNQPPQTVL